MPAFEMVFSLNSMNLNSRSTDFVYSKLDSVWRLFLFYASNLSNQHEQGIIELIDHAFFQREDRIVGNVDLFGAHFRAALGDVAQADAKFILEHLGARLRIQRMHFE